MHKGRNGLFFAFTINNQTPNRLRRRCVIFGSLALDFLAAKAASASTSGFMEYAGPKMNVETASVALVEAHEATPHHCRLCGSKVDRTFVDLGMSPLCESFIPPDRVDDMEPFYPLHALVCGECFLVQLKEYVSPENIFEEYAYFSSYSTSWVSHAKAYAEMIIERLGLGSESLVVELASNDGYLLQHFLPFGIPVLGVEPAANVAQIAVQKGIPTEVDFFGVRLAQDLVRRIGQADLIAGNNVLAQVPDLNDFVAGIRVLLKPGGIVTLEFSHLQRLMEENQFDTIYHEHFSYFSLLTIEKMAARHQLKLVDVEELPTHGGSLRVYLVHKQSNRKPTEAVEALLQREEKSRVSRSRYLFLLRRAGEANQATAAVLPDQGEGRR